VTRRLQGRLGALHERDFRLLFLATTITTVGDGLASIALAFAVLDRGSAVALGVVLAVRQGVEAVVVLFGGVIADRLPRNLVLSAASLVQAAAQAATAAVVLSGGDGVWAIVLLQGAYGIGAGVVIPAEVGLVPQTVSPARLQQANALQGLSRNIVRVLGPAVGGVLVVAGSPGVALAVDAVSFVVCAALLALIRVAPLVREQGAGMIQDLRAGWRVFTDRTWLWASVVLFGIGNFAIAAWVVLGPLVAKQDLGGAGPWAFVLTMNGVGSVLGGLVAIRVRPSRPLVACTIAAVPISFQLVALALVTPVWVLAITSFVAGAGIAIHLTLWFTLFQREIPEELQSRVASYDTLGSFVLMPLGMAIAGPLADAFGVSATLWCAVAVMWASWLGILALPSVWALRARPVVEPDAAAA
jgi:MFS family permease